MGNELAHALGPQFCIDLCRMHHDILVLPDVRHGWIIFREAIQDGKKKAPPSSHHRGAYPRRGGPVYHIITINLSIECLNPKSKFYIMIFFTLRNQPKKQKRA